MVRIVIAIGFAAVCASVPTEPAYAIDVPPPGTTSCSGCHAMSRSAGTPVTRLIARNPADIVAAMQEFRAGKRPATVMDRIAKGFTDEEINAIAAWYAAQKE